MINVGISGASGRMGKELIAGILNSEDLKLGCALIEKDSDLIGKNVGEILNLGKLDINFGYELDTQTQVVIDFSLPQAINTNLEFCLKNKIPLVIGTTGFNVKQKQLISDAGKKIPVLLAANMSLGVNACIKLVELTTKMLGNNYDVEILDIHHRFKLDSPSGTALALGEAVAQARGEELANLAVYERHSLREQRDKKQIGIVSMRMGDYVGEHKVIFSTLGETVEIVHKASSRATFANGALHAAKWLVDKPAGFYNMANVLGL